jgi:hypothetical protein
VPVVEDSSLVPPQAISISMIATTDMHRTDRRTFFADNILASRP